MKRRLLKLGLLLLALGVGGFLVAASGVIPIKASSGHWAVTKWVLRFGMKRSTATHSLGIDVPRLDDPRLVVKGAGHYETGCRSCHGSPEMPQPRIALKMTPRPPELASRILESDAKKLFYVVKHGIKFTAMPAWPAQERDDEVWAMVAFLLRYPTLDAATYRRLVHGETAAAPMERLGAVPDTPAAVAQACARCHGQDGRGRENGAFPSLAGQRETYLRNALVAYAQGTRFSGMMEPIAAGLSEGMRNELTRYYASLPAAAPAGEATRRDADADDARARERGAEIARDGIAARRVPACLECHGPTGRRVKDAYPRLAGQSADYLELQLRLFKAGQRGGSAYAHLMEEVVAGLNPEDMRAVALYFEALRAPGGETAAAPR